jgi:hypothetical protein
MYLLTKGVVMACNMFALIGKRPEETQWPCHCIECSGCKFQLKKEVPLYHDIPCAKKDKECYGNMCKGFEQTAPDDKCYNYVPEYRPYLCTRMNAECPKATTCYSETIEHDDTSCSEGMILCPAVDDPNDRVMYSVEVLKNLDNDDNYDDIPF